MHHPHQRRGRSADWCAALAALALHALAGAQTTNTVSVETTTPSANALSSTNGAPITTGPASGPISDAMLAGSPDKGGYAAAGGAQQTLRSMAVGSGNSSAAIPDGAAQSTSAFDWAVTVGTGQSGLAQGAAVTLVLGLRVDGRLSAGHPSSFAPSGGFAATLPPDYNLYSSASARLTYGISDTSLQGYEAGTPDFSFEYSGTVAYSGGSTTSSATHTVWSTAESMARAQLQGGGNWVWAGNQPYDFVSYSGIPLGHRTLDVDTGTLLFSFDTFVGHVLRFDASLVSMIQGDARNALSWVALADFANTFDVELSTSTAGIELIGYSPGVYGADIAAPVPEPQTWALMAAGLAALGFMSRRRQCSPWARP